jgi:ribose transport system permease protein
MMKRKIKLNSLVPFVILAVMAIIFAIATKGQVLGQKNIENIFSQSVTTIIAGLGMLFVVSMGGTDITHGALLGVAAAFATMAGKYFGAIWMFPVAILIGACSGIFLGIITSKFKVPSFMASLSMLIALRAFLSWLLNGQAIMAPLSIKFIDGFAFKVCTLVALIVIITYVFNFTPFGTYVKAIGENENAVKHVGISVDKIKIIAFVISGVMAAIAGVFTVVRVGGASNTIGIGFEMKVMMAMFIGGIPVQGGMGSKIYKLILGVFTITLLENGLVLCGASGGITQLIRGFVLLGAVYLTRIMYTKVNATKKIKNVVQIQE